MNGRERGSFPNLKDRLPSNDAMELEESLGRLEDRVSYLKESALFKLEEMLTQVPAKDEEKKWAREEIATELKNTDERLKKLSEAKKQGAKDSEVEAAMDYIVTEKLVLALKRIERRLYGQLTQDQRETLRQLLDKLINKNK